MSAFIVNKAHIDALIRAGLTDVSNPLMWEGDSGYVAPPSSYCRLNYPSADEVGQMLWRENFRSVRHRYPNSGNNLPGPVDMPDPEEYRFDAVRTPVPTSVEALKWLSFYEYQSCECSDWEKTEAFRFCQALRRFLITRLPGYSEAPWEARS